MVLSKPSNDKCRDRNVGDNVHGNIVLIYPLTLIVDTEEFQRLRDIKQLGMSSHVYPTADHSRFIHSLGVYHMATQVVKELKKKLGQHTIFYKDGVITISYADELCVAIAALCHDLGHGPFSHFFETFVKKTSNGKSAFKHEDMSLKVFNLMLERNPHLKRALDPDLGEEDYLFIGELIHPPKEFVVDGVWQLKGRPMEKSFLYDIVSNVHDGVDVDKMDYFLRDAKSTNVGIQYNEMSFKRFLQNIVVKMDARLGYRRLVATDKVDIEEIYHSRMNLHKKVYQHKTCIALELKMIEVLTKADPHLVFRADNGKKYKLSDAFNEPSAYVRLNDHVLTNIANSEKLELDGARAALKALRERQIHKRAGTISKLFTTETSEKIAGDLVGLSGSSFKQKDIYVHIVQIRPGTGVVEDPKLTVKMSGESYAFVYTPYGTSKRVRESVTKTITMYEELRSLVEPDSENKKRHSTTSIDSLYPVSDKKANISSSSAEDTSISSTNLSSSM